MNLKVKKIRKLNLFKAVFVFILLSPISLFSQKETNTWYFGSWAGLDFNGGSAVALTNSAMAASEGTAAMSDKNTGQILFYTDGVSVWDKTNSVMPNGTGLLAAPSTSQAALIVPDPGNVNQYYLFAVDQQAGGMGSSGSGGLTYSIVDMTLNGGLGNVSATKNIPLVTPTTEQVTGYKHCNGTDYWVIVHKFNTGELYAYQITATGILAPVISNVAFPVSGFAFQGTMKVSPNGKYLAWAIVFSPADRCELFEFDNSTGVISNKITVSTGENVYGVEFSPDNSKLYIASNSWGVIQHQIGCGSVSGRYITVGPKMTGIYVANPPKSLQLGPDGRIYIGRALANDSIDVIVNPNAAGVVCNYQVNLVSLNGKTSDYGLPNFLTSYFDKVPGSKPANFLGNDTVLCASSFLLDAGAGCNEQYLWSTGATTQTINISTRGQYWVQKGKCPIWDTINITLGSLSISTSVNPVTCNGGSNGSAVVSAAGGSGIFSYSWSSGQTSLTASGLSATIYTVTVTDGSSCNTASTVTITAPGVITFATPTVADAACGVNDGSASITASGGTGGLSYSWSNNSSGQTISSVGAGTYILTVTDANSCTNTTSVLINSNPSATINSVNITQVKCSGQNNGAASVSVSGGTGALTYSWNNGTSGATISTVVAGTYIISVTDASGCLSQSSVVITEPASIASTQSAAGTCTGKTDGSATVTITGGTGPYTYSWSNSTTATTTNQTSQISNLSSQAYTVTITDANNCTATAAAIVALFPNPTANAGTDQTIATGTSVQLNATGGTSYLWTPAATLNNSGIANPIASPAQSTTYTVVVIDANTCTATDLVTIFVDDTNPCAGDFTFIPTAFSPNADGQNDVLYLRGSLCIKKVLLKIFDRWGEIVFETTDVSKGWDGKLRSKESNTGVFVYTLDAELYSGETISKSGNFTLIR